MKKVTSIISGFLLLISIIALTPSGASAEPYPHLYACRVISPDADTREAFELSTPHAEIWRLYVTLFNREPDPIGMSYWVRIRSNGTSLTEISSEMVTSAEFNDKYSYLNNSDYLDLIYKNALCRNPDTVGKNFWLQLLNQGRVSRGFVAVSFSESSEFKKLTQICNSGQEFDNQLNTCIEKPAEIIEMIESDYQIFKETVVKSNRQRATIQGIEIPIENWELLGVGTQRCSVASINANWMPPRDIFKEDPRVLGLGIIDGEPVTGSGDRTDRGILGMRVSQTPRNIIQVWDGGKPSSEDTRLNSVLVEDGYTILEQWHAFSEASPYMTELNPHLHPHESEWIWAVAGVPIIINGQIDDNLNNAVREDPHTYLNQRHSMFWQNRETGNFYVGSTTTMSVPELVEWATKSNHDELIMFDGGTSTEFNVNGEAVVNGTSRSIPLWLGVGC